MTKIKDAYVMYPVHRDEKTIVYYPPNDNCASNDGVCEFCGSNPGEGCKAKDKEKQL